MHVAVALKGFGEKFQFQLDRPHLISWLTFWTIKNTKIVFHDHHVRYEVWGGLVFKGFVAHSGQ